MKNCFDDFQQRVVVEHPVERGVEPRIGSELATPHQIAQTFELLVGHAMQPRVSVFAFQRHDQKRPDREALARAAAHDAGVLKRDGLIDHRRDRRLENRNVDMLPVPESEIARRQRLHRGNRAVQRRDILRERARRCQRFAIGLADRKRPSAAREQHQVIQLAVALRSVLPEIRNRNDRQARELRDQLVGRETKRGERAGREVFNQKIGAVEQSREKFAAALMLQVRA